MLPWCVRYKPQISILGRGSRVLWFDWCASRYALVMKIYGQGHFGSDARDNTSGVYQLPGCRFMSWKLLLLHKFFGGFVTCCIYMICSLDLEKVMRNTVAMMSSGEAILLYLQFSYVHLNYRFKGGAHLVSRVYLYVIYGFIRALGLVEWLAFFSYSWAVSDAYDGFVMKLRLAPDCVCVSFYIGPTELSPTSLSCLLRALGWYGADYSDTSVLVALYSIFFRALMMYCVLSGFE